MFTSYFKINKINFPLKQYLSQWSKSFFPVELSSTAYGEPNNKKPPIIILHGVMGSKHNWATIANKLYKQTGQLVFCLDSRNHGYSPQTSDMTYHHMAADLEKFIDKQNWPSAIIMGHSMGGRTAMLLSLLQPTLVSSLIVVDVSPINKSSARFVSKYVQALQSVVFPPDVTLSEARNIADKQISSEIPDTRIRQFLLTSLDINGNKIFWRFNLKVLNDDFLQFPRLPTDTTFTKPTLFIVGGKSDFVQKEDLPEIKNMFPMSRFEFIADAGHWVHAEQPQKVLDAVVSFLNK